MKRQIDAEPNDETAKKAKDLFRMTQQWLTYWILMVGLSFISVHLDDLWEMIFDNFYYSFAFGIFSLWLVSP